MNSKAKNIIQDYEHRIRSRQGEMSEDLFLEMGDVVSAAINEDSVSQVEIVEQFFRLLREIFRDLTLKSKGYGANQILELARKFQFLTETAFSFLLDSEIEFPGVFDSYDARQMLYEYPSEDVENFLYKILEAVSADRLGAGIAFFAHEFLFSFSDYERMIALKHNYVADMLKDDLLMTSERMLADCYRILGNSKKFSSERVESLRGSIVLRLISTAREFEPMRRHWIELNKTKDRKTNDVIFKKNMEYCKGLLFTLNDK